MFELEKAVAEWRQQMLAAGIKTPAPLEELEGHLREGIERQMKSGLRGQNAFEISVQQMGQPKPLNREFKKIERNFMKRMLIVGVGIFVVLAGTAMILPALGKHKQRNLPALSAGANYFSTSWAPDEKYGLALGSVVAVAGVTMMVWGFKKRQGTANV